MIIDGLCVMAGILIGFYPVYRLKEYYVAYRLLKLIEAGKYTKVDGDEVSVSVKVKKTYGFIG